MTQKPPLILAINPGSTTTKLALYVGEQEQALENHEHSVEELSQFPTIFKQFTFRRDLVIAFLDKHRVKPGSLAIAMGRGGLLHPLPSGVYRVNHSMLRDLESCMYGEHACNLGAPLADAVAKRFGCEALIADPVVVDEMIDEARISGLPEIQRKSIFHALNHKFVARRAAAQLNRKYEEVNLIVAHLGGGISVGSHHFGKVIDVNNALDGEGPLTPERTGGLPAGDLIRLALSGNYTYVQLKKMITGSGGIFAYTGTRDVKQLAEQAQQGDSDANFFIRALVYQISKEIAAHFAVLQGKVDAIVLTGGIAHNEWMMKMVEERVGAIAQIIVLPGEGEMQSLAENAFAVINQMREVTDYA